jgi:hypothetical protein
MFKFLKEMIDSVREGAAEAKAELAQEAAEKAAGDKAGNQAAEERLAATSAYEKFLVALGTPYKLTYTRELTAAARDEKPVVFLYCMALPPDEKVSEFQSMLKRDFSVTDSGSLEATYGAMLMTEIEPEVPTTDKAALALWLSRAAYLVSTGAAIGYLPPTQALAMSEPIVQQALARFDSWADFGQHFVQGEKSAPGSNALGSGFLKRSVDALLGHALSPWLHLAWPVSPSDRDELLASRPRGQAVTEAD